MANFLYTILIQPLEFLFSFVIDFSAPIVSLPFSVIILSIFVQLISIPFYVIAYKIEKIEKNLQKIIAPELAVLKTLYKGEELFNRTDALYKRLHYNPLLGFRASMSLFLVIPFFIAAYNTLNYNPLFNDVYFLGLFNLSNPDGLLFGINILPILMTIFNLIAIKSSNPKKDLLDQSNAMLLLLSIFFLVYLYNSASALLLYWTSNNLIYMIRLIITSKKSSV